MQDRIMKSNVRRGQRRSNCGSKGPSGITVKPSHGRWGKGSRSESLSGVGSDRTWADPGRYRGLIPVALHFLVERSGREGRRQSEEGALGPGGSGRRFPFAGLLCSVLAQAPPSAGSRRGTEGRSAGTRTASSPSSTIPDPPTFSAPPPLHHPLLRLLLSKLAFFRDHALPIFTLTSLDYFLSLFDPLTTINAGDRLSRHLHFPSPVSE